jgi:hypothetical protein
LRTFTYFTLFEKTHFTIYAYVVLINFLLKLYRKRKSTI